MKDDERFKDKPLPGERSIARFLEAEGFTQPYERHSALPQPARAAPQAPHEEWEMDACGQERVPEVGIIALINWKRQQVEITFDASEQRLIFHSEQGEPIKRCPIQGITPEALMGEMGPLVGLPAFQLALPFTWDQWRMIRLCDTLGDTT